MWRPPLRRPVWCPTNPSPWRIKDGSIGSVPWGISRVGWNVWYKAFGGVFFIGGNLFSCFPYIFVLMGSYMDQCMGLWKIAAYIHLWFGGLKHGFYRDPIWLAHVFFQMGWFNHQLVGGLSTGNIRCWTCNPLPDRIIGSIYLQFPEETMEGKHLEIEVES